MALSSKRSPSPQLTRPTNPNLRNSETNSSIRRSFSGNPFARPSVLTNPKSFNPITPANSPADYGRRTSIGKEGASRGFEEKENEKDSNSKLLKLKSPAKGSKNFMSPTISAASKFTPSPRKKILVERNEPNRNSISFTDGKEPFLEDYDSKLEMGFNQNETEGSCDSNLAGFEQNEAVLEVPSVPKASKRVTFSQVPLNLHDELESSSEITANSDCVNTESNPNNNEPCALSMSPIAPLDADPSFPPYDPKTNYLSPRPQFLRYKPNPRIEVFLNNEKGLDFEDAKGLEDSFVMSEISSDTDVTEEAQSGDSPKESEDGSSSNDTIIPEEKEEEPLVPEPIPISTPTCTLKSEQTVEAKRAPSNSWFFKRSVSISILLVLLIACVSISMSDSPVIDLPVFNDLNFYELYESYEVDVTAKKYLDEFARNSRLWSSKVMSYLYNLIPDFGEVDKLDTIKFINLTSLQEHSLVGGYLEVNHYNEKIEENYEDELVSMEAGEDELRMSEEEKTDTEDGADEPNGEVLEGKGSSEIEDEVLSGCENSEEVLHQEQIDTSARSDAGLQSNIESGDHQWFSTSKPPETTPELEAFEIKPEEVLAMEFKVDNGLSYAAKIESSVADGNPEYSSEITVLEPVETPTDVIEDEFSKPVVLGISLLVLAIVAATTFTYLKPRRANNTNVLAHVDPVSTKKHISGAISAEYIYQDRPFVQNWPTEDVVGESCPSEMSSFQKSSSYSKGAFRGSDNAQSQERKPIKNSKQESLSSSSGYSMGSPSYGSFTTYERIPVKNGEEEMVTPVRRSSRIRSQVTSP